MKLSLEETSQSSMAARIVSNRELAGGWPEGTGRLSNTSWLTAAVKNRWRGANSGLLAGAAR